MGQTEYFFTIEKEEKIYHCDKDIIDDWMSFINLCLIAVCGTKVETNETLIQDEKYGWTVNYRKRLKGLPIIKSELSAALLENADSESDQKRMKRESGDNSGFLSHTYSILKEKMDASIQFYSINLRKEEPKCISLMKKISGGLEQFVFWITFSSYIFPEYRRIFSYLQDDKRLKLPTKRFILSIYHMFSEVSGEEYHNLLGNNGIFYGCFFQYDQVYEQMKMGECLCLKKRVFDYIEQDDSEDRLPDILSFCIPEISYHNENSIDEIYYDLIQVVNQKVVELFSNNIKDNAFHSNDRNNVLYLHGSLSDGLYVQLRKCVERIGKRIIFIELLQPATWLPTRVQEFIDELQLESILGNRVVCFIDNIPKEVSEEDENKTSVLYPERFQYLIENIVRRIGSFLWISKEKNDYFENYDLCLTSYEWHVPTMTERYNIWKESAKKFPLDSKINLKLTANNHIFSSHKIQKILKTADLIRVGNQEEVISIDSFRQAMAMHTRNQLGGLATKVEVVYAWDDIILEPDQKEQMLMICNQIKYRDMINEEWDYRKKAPYGQGICALFYGAPGTGKTMAAQVMANELGMELYRIDLSRLVSKYIGETQKNISMLFQKAKNMNALLFFDEADALFAKRTEVKQSNDRQANSEVAHLLQKLEEHEGITILATNYVNNIDEAFKRRIKFMIRINAPEAEERFQLWKEILPENVPCEQEIDFRYFADRFELSGSQIKEILTNAAFIAASENTGLKNTHIVEAIISNYSKYGKVLAVSDFKNFS